MISTNFILATDSGLTNEFGGFFDLIHNSDFSDNPQDMTILYLGSTNALHYLQAASNPGVDNITLTPVDEMPKWQSSTAVTLNQIRQPAISNGFVYQVTTAGTTGASAPTWPTTIGSTVTSGTAVFTCLRTKHSINEITLALSAPALATNTPGAALSLGNTINGGLGNLKTIYIRINNAVSMTSNSTSQPDIGIQINSVKEF